MQNEEKTKRKKDDDIYYSNFFWLRFASKDSIILESGAFVLNIKCTS